MLLSVCDMCVAFSNPERSKTGQKKRCWKVHVRLVWYGQINLPQSVGVDCGEVKMTAEMEQNGSKHNRRCTQYQLLWDCFWQAACVWGIVSSEIVVLSFVEYGVRLFLRNLNTYVSCYIGPHFMKTWYFKLEVFIILQCIGREGKINIWLLIEILEIVVNFIRITYTLYIDLREILNSKLRHNFN